VIADLDAALGELFAFTGTRAPGRSSLVAMARAMELLGNPQERLRVIHVTGTSGKTSTCYYIRGLLEAAGVRTGLTVSPHIQALNERVQIGGVPLPVPQFCAAVSELLERLKPLTGQLTYFELVICLALMTFEQYAVQYAVVEVGIGGTRDATNIARRGDKVAVITPVGLDHTEKLGGTIGEIAAQKAGIMVPGGVAVVAEQSPEALTVIQQYASGIGATVHLVPAPATGRTSLPAFQEANWALARAVVDLVAARDGLTLQANLDYVRHQTPPARYEWFQVGAHSVLLDGAHSPQKMAGLVHTLQAQGHAPMPALATLSTAPPDKVTATLAALAPAVTRLIVPEFTLGRDDKVKVSVPATQVAAAATARGVPVDLCPDLATALHRLLADPAPELLVTGSLYLAALVRPLLHERP